MAQTQKRGVVGTPWNSTSPAKIVATKLQRQGSPIAANRPGQVELIISSALRYGVLISSVLIAVGVVALLLSLYQSASPPSLSSVLSSRAVEAGVLRSPSEVLYGLMRRDPNAVIALGLLVLMATPIVPVLLSAVSFLLAREKPFILITLGVLTILTVSFLLGASA